MCAHIIRVRLLFRAIFIFPRSGGKSPPCARCSFQISQFCVAAEFRKGCEWKASAKSRGNIDYGRVKCV